MLFALGDDVGFVMRDGRKIDCPKTACLLHDDDGKSWSKDSLLIMRIPSRGRAATDDETRGVPGWWLGKDYEAETSMIDTPSRALSQWKLVGEVEEIFYDRFGSKAPGVFKHAFNKARGLYRIVAAIKGKRAVRLYKLERAYRLELGAGSMIREIGLVWP